MANCSYSRIIVCTSECDNRQQHQQDLQR
jgi:hypothetical protein